MEDYSNTNLCTTCDDDDDDDDTIDDGFGD